MNVIVMAMSTLPIRAGRLLPSCFLLNGEEKIYFSQMEPGSRTILGDLAADQDVKFIILGTTATQQKKVFEYMMHGSETTEEVDEISGQKKETIKWNPGKKVNASAIDFFKMRMGLAELTEPDAEEICNICSKSESEEQVKVVTVQEDNLTPAIAETINYIREIWNDDCKLWIDTQGGFRNIVLVINAIISLLREDGIEPEAVYSINYGGNNNPQKVINQKDTYKIFQFVSGINEFRRYGRAEQLEDYYKSIGQNVPEEIVQMKKMAEAIQMCDMEKFDTELEEFRNLSLIEKKREGFLDIFWNQIKEDYANLMTEQYTGLDVVEWLYKKNFYQQAITYLEARLPKEWIEIKYLQNGEALTDQEDSANKKLITCTIEKSDLEAKRPYQNEVPENTVINILCAACIEWKKIIQEKKYTKKQKLQCSFHAIKELQEGVRKNYQLFKAEDGYMMCCYLNKSQNSIPSPGIYCMEKVDHFGGKQMVKRIDSMMIHCTDKEKANRVLYLLVLYKLLKNERNAFNHMGINETRASKEDLGKVIKLFIEIGRSLDL